MKKQKTYFLLYNILYNKIIHIAYLDFIFYNLLVQYTKIILTLYNNNNNNLYSIQLELYNK